MADTVENTSETTDAGEGTNIQPDATEASDGLNDGGKKALASERQARRDAEKAVKALEARIQEFEDLNASELQKAQKAADRAASKATDAETRADKAEAKLTRFEVAAEFELSGDAVELLTGSTREEIEASATKIKALLDGAKPSAPVVPEAGDAPGDSSDSDVFARGILLGR